MRILDLHSQYFKGIVRSDFMALKWVFTFEFSCRLSTIVQLGKPPGRVYPGTVHFETTHGLDFKTPKFPHHVI